MALIVSVSGVRGIVGTELTPDIAVRYAAALGTVLGAGPIAVGRDSRPSGRALTHAVMAGLMGVGADVCDLGIVPTPTCGYLVRELGCRGGLQITASHNPSPYNGLKLFGPDGAVLSATAGKEVQAVFEHGQFHQAPWDGCGTASDATAEFERHRDAVLAVTDVNAIRRRGFRAVVDANGGAGGPLAISLLKALNVGIVAVACQPDGVFRHEPEPIPSHLGEIAGIVKVSGGAMGFVLDPDADRLALIDENGRCLSEELTLAIAVRERLAQTTGPVVINLSSSRVTEDIAAAAGMSCHRAAVGEANVTGKMREVAALIGGEGNGGVIDPRIGWVRDPFIGMSLVLSHLVRTGKSLAELASDLPAYFIQKDKYLLPRERLDAAFGSLAAHWPEATRDKTDGLRLAWADGWIHVRGSNTEPIVRVIAEATSAEEAAMLCSKAGEFLSTLP